MEDRRRSLFQRPGRDGVIILTPSAVRRLKTLLSEHPEESRVRLSIIQENENKIVHRITLEDAASEEDRVQDCDGITIVMDPSTARRMDGVILDYAETGNKTGFRFRHAEPATDDALDVHRN